MSAHWVPLTANNIQSCAPLWGDRHTYSPEELARALAVTGDLLHRRRALGAVVLEDTVVRGFGVSVFIDEGWIAAVLAEGQPQIAKQLLLAINPRDESGPILGHRRIAERNAGHGLTVQVVSTNYDMWARDPQGVLGSIMSAFMTVHRGYRLQRIVNEVFGDHAVGFVDKAGGFEIRHRFADVGGIKGLSSVIGTATREQAVSRPDPLLLAMFVYETPRLGLAERQQELLRVAITGLPDTIVAKQLGVSLAAVKARWTRILERVWDVVPDILAPAVVGRRRRDCRGVQSRHLLLEYLRNHPSELTPYPVSRRSRHGAQTAVRFRDDDVSAN